MKHSRLLLALLAALNLTTEAARAAEEDAFMGEIRTPLEQTVGQGQTVLWTLPLVATQYQPLQPVPVMQEALQAQNEGRFLEALILLDEAGKSGQVSGDAMAGVNLLHASFLLQGNQYQQALDMLAPLLGNARFAADAYALTAMAHLEQGHMQEALKAAQRACDAGDGMLSHLALSYALQGTGRLKEAREAMRAFNSRTPQAITLAREAELALTLGQVQAARALLNQAQGAEAAHPYVTAVSGFTYLIGGQARPAKVAFETALRRDPRDAKALLGLGLAETRLGNFDEGQKKLQAASEAEPGNALILTYLGRAQQQAGQTGAALVSWHSAQQADPKDPTPWLYLAQAQLQTNRLLEARESLREAQARSAYRAVYRGANLLREDAQLLQTNLAEIQRRLGLDNLALHTLSDPVGEKNSASLRAQAEVLQGQRFAESARRSLLLQSQFNEHPGNLPAALDIYGDGAGQTGAGTPQHGAVSMLGAQQASYNNYDELFSRHTALEADAIGGNQNTSGEQIRLGVGNDMLGLGIAQRQYKTDGNAPFEKLNNNIAQGIVQWRPTQSTQAFVSHQDSHTQHDETLYPTLPWGSYDAIVDNSRVTRVGLRHSLTDHSELRALWSEQHTNQINNYFDFFGAPGGDNSGNSSAHSEELQYRHSGAGYATQWGAQQNRAPTIVTGFSDFTRTARQFYAAWQQALDPHWQLEAQLGRGAIDYQDNVGNSSTHLKRWLPKLGLVYAPDTGTHLRVAAMRGMGFGDLGDAALAPVSLAGIVLNRPDDTSPNGKLVQAVALGADKQLSAGWLLDAQAQRRWTNTPAIDVVGQQILIWQKIDESRLALHWQPKSHQWTVNLVCDYERIQNDPLYPYLPLNSLNIQSLSAQQLNLHWFASSQATLNLTWSHNRVAGSQPSFDDAWNPILIDYKNRFDLLDADMSWQFNNRAQLAAGVRNAGNVRFQYEDIDPLTPRFSNGRLVYAKLKFVF